MAKVYKLHKQSQNVESTTICNYEFILAVLACSCHVVFQYTSGYTFMTSTWIIDPDLWVFRYSVSASPRLALALINFFMPRSTEKISLSVKGLGTYYKWSKIAILFFFFQYLVRIQTLASSRVYLALSWQALKDKYYWW